VFLCQGEGARNWLVSEDREVPEDASSDSLSLLEPFKPTEEHICGSGDVLYVPPGIPHWGVAKDFCTTYSIGMRAPTRDELAAGHARIYTPDSETSQDVESATPSVFYRDPDLQVSEVDDGRISADSIRRIREQHLLDDSLSDRDMLTILGSVITDPKAWLDPDAATATEVEAVLCGRQALQVHGMALLAWGDADDRRMIFANGSAREIPPAATDLVRALCGERVAMPDVVRSLATLPEGRDFITWLLDRGVLDID
jgi:50S ribosomal protein L16 3-hydroxylase